ncbi:hypothetical protein VULLAG_LOCUS1627 [Vulpes lagopus]
MFLGMRQDTGLNKPDRIPQE